MFVEITDNDALRAISPIDLSGYIKSKGGSRKQDYRDVAVVWEYGTKSILIPKDKDLADYCHIIKSAISRISEIEDRTQLSVYTDIKNMGFDIIRVSSKSSSTSNGTILLEKNVDLISNAQDMLLAVACSAATGKSSYTSRKPQDAESFIKKIRMGQTEHGSYVLTILSPVAPDLVPSQIPLPLPDSSFEEEQYDLRVVPLLSTALSVIPQIAEAASANSSAEPFIENASKGITSNLCDAIVGMYETTDDDGSISVSINFSKNRKHPYSFFSQKFDSTFIPILKSASQYIKQSQPEPDQIVRGIITDLHRSENDNRGRITIFDTYGKRPRAVSLSLPDDQYEKFTTVHTERKVIEVEGCIKKEKNRLFIEPSSAIKVLEDPKDD